MCTYTAQTGEDVAHSGSLLLVHPRFDGGKQLSFPCTFYVRPPCAHSTGFSRLQETCVCGPLSRCALCMICRFHCATPKSFAIHRNEPNLCDGFSTALKPSLRLHLHSHVNLISLVIGGKAGPRLPSSAEVKEWSAVYLHFTAWHFGPEATS
jgi:hypothetical protein